MVNEPTLADAINADRARRGETVAAWAAREGVPLKTVERWICSPPSTSLARLLAAKIAR